MKLYQRIIFVIITVLFSLALTLYTGYGLQDLFSSYRQAAPYYWGLCIGVFFVTGISVLYFAKPHHLLRKWQNYLVSLCFSVLLGQIIYSIFLLIADIVSYAHIPLALWLNKIGAILVGCFIIAVVHGSVWGKYRYTLHKETISFEDLPLAFDGCTIVQISDVHAGSFDSPRSVERGIELIKAQNPDIFVFTGDLVNNDAYEFLPWKDIFKNITAPLGQYSILGNHDYGDYVARKSNTEKMANIALLKQHHKDIGWRLLLNEHIILEKGGDKIALVGVENRGDGFSRYGDLDVALQGVDPHIFTLLLSHDPSHWDKHTKHHKKHVHLTLAGHTHAMQIGFDFSWFKWSPIVYRYKKWAGLYQELGKYLYVNRGFGFLGLSARVGMRPEITVLELKRSI